MSVAPHAGIIDFGTFTSPDAPKDGIQGEVPAPLVTEVGYVLSTEGWVPAGGGGDGTVTSVDVSGGTTGLTTSGGPVTTSGIIAIDGVLNIANGGTGQITAANAINALLPTQTGNTGKVLGTNGTIASWVTTGGLGDVVGPASATDNAIARFDTTTGKLIQNSTVIVNDAGDMSGIKSETYTGVAPTSPVIGTMWFDSSDDSLNFKQNNITQQIGEETFIYGRATEDIIDGQVIAFTGAYGTTGVITFAPAPIGTTNSSYIIGIATEPILKNAFGRITAFGTIHGLYIPPGISTGDVLWYDPTVVGGYTNVVPAAPAVKCQVGIVTKAAGGTNESIAVRVIPGGTFGITESNVQFGTLANKDLIQYDSTNQYWKNVSESAVFADITTVSLTTGTISSVPANGLDLVNKSYVDLIAGAGIHIHTPVLVETPTALTATYVDGGTTPTWTKITTKRELTTASAHGLVINDVIVFGSNTSGLTAGIPYFVYSVPTTTSITLSLTYGGAEITSLTNGTGLSITSRANAGVGATLTNSGTLAALTIDNVALAVGNRVLVYRQASAFQNGVYTVTTVGSGSVAWVLTRASDANTYAPNSPTSLGEGDYFFVQSGDTGKGESYVLTTTGTIIFGTTNLTFTQFSDSAVYSAGTGLTLTGNTFSITPTGTAGTYGSTSLIPIITTNASGQVTSVTTAANPQGTVTSVAALTLGTTGTDLSSTVANATSTPVITLQVPTASATNRGALSSTDWSTFNGKQDTLVSTTNIKSINGASILGSGDLTVSGSFTGGTLTSALVLAAGTASLAPLDFQTGTNLTTAAAGSMEFDGTVPYFSIAASTRGAIPTEQWVVLTGTNTLTSQTGVQPIFDGGGGPAGGAVTLPVGTYQFECDFALTGMSATTGSFGFGLGGTATKTFSYHSTSAKAGTSLTTSMATLQLFSTAANTALQTTSTGTVGTALIKGIIRVTVAGTVIPQVSLTVASAAVIQTGSYFRISPIGNATVATVGNWA